MMAGVANVLDTTLEGSADGYATTVDDTGKFFVHFLTRDCAALKDLPGWPRNCTAITADMVPTSGSATARGDPALFDTLIVGIGDYVRPGTRSGPDSTQLLRPRVLAFTKQ